MNNSNNNSFDDSEDMEWEQDEHSEDEYEVNEEIEWEKLNENEEMREIIGKLEYFRMKANGEDTHLPDEIQKKASYELFRERYPNVTRNELLSELKRCATADRNSILKEQKIKKQIHHNKVYREHLKWIQDIKEVLKKNLEKN